MRFHDIPQFTKSASYAADISWLYLEKWYGDQVEETNFDVNPDFQRGYVWVPLQKTRYVEFILRGGTTGRDIFTNCPCWGRRLPKNNEYVLVDGKQRLEAVLGFLRNEVPIFGGHFRKDFTDEPNILTASFRWHVNDLKTRSEVLQWYLDLNSGGTVHSEEEFARVRKLLERALENEA